VDERRLVGQPFGMTQYHLRQRHLRNDDVPIAAAKNHGAPPLQASMTARSMAHGTPDFGWIAHASKGHGIGMSPGLTLGPANEPGRVSADTGVEGQSCLAAAGLGCCTVDSIALSDVEVINPIGPVQSRVRRYPAAQRKSYVTTEARPGRR